MNRGNSAQTENLDAIKDKSPATNSPRIESSFGKNAFNDPDVSNVRKALMFFYFKKLKNDKKIEIVFTKNTGQGNGANTEIENKKLPANPLSNLLISIN